MIGNSKELIQDLKKRLAIIGDFLDLSKKESRLKELEEITGKPEFWDNADKAQETLKEQGQIKNTIDEWKTLSSDLEDLEVLEELSLEEGDEESSIEVKGQLSEIEIKVENLEFKRILGEPDDASNAIVSINAGAGGTEAQDWAEILLRMYLRYAERNGFTSEIVEYQEGDEAGLKSTTFLVNGDYSFGYLKAESGVHRLVRISPFDSNKRRHTSFASVFVSPQIDDSIDVDIDEKDLRIDTYRASGAGGQHVNKTDSAIRITHAPSGIVVSCQNERSQRQNKETAMKILRARLYELEREKQREKLAELNSTKKEIGWGSQIRSYVLHPYRMIKDHRTDFETGNVDPVLDGDLSEFIKSYLLYSSDQKTS
ncbi:MAG: peptide chain release factor 2 [Thermodesulfobacteriota bacterium]|nr:peptide chain release factor 2 [Candidatus Dadabacteria bacterium]MCZ6556115.1 peptide chain release factor 2 [Candidatus Dadabacteria bacterium]MCZ6790567.1 peptide chain release factor 2 [Candidatus Dadabacteria bacterium]MCZ6865070.1 peptide chain release factor 2 [Candidatus Dadabacteria bacterium]